MGDGRHLLESLLRNPPDLVFNFAEGSGVSRSREARVPAVCEMLGIPCTGSDPLALAVALDKDMTRRVVESFGVTIPKGITLAPPPGDYDGDCAEFLPVLEEAGLTLPVIAKPDVSAEKVAPAPASSKPTANPADPPTPPAIDRKQP